jgi:hypothetical protein
MMYKLSVYLLALASPLAAQPSPARAAQNRKPGELWSLQPVVRPQIPSHAAKSANPIDAFIAANYQAKGLRPVGPAPKLALLRRVYLDLIGIPPSPTEQDAFLKDESQGAYEKVVDQLLTNPQHGVRYARRWLDVLRYADVDERMLAAPGIHLWRDWVIDALNRDVPYDEFVRAQLTGYRSRQRTQMSATGVRSRKEPRLDDMFALGFLARGDVIRDGKETQELSLMAADTVGTAFMGMTVGCAKCHDHMYDPISQRDYYSMKALFDPLMVRKVTLASPADIVVYGKALEEYQKKSAPLEQAVDALTAPYKKQSYDDPVAVLLARVRPIILKSEHSRGTEDRRRLFHAAHRLRQDQEVLPPERPPTKDLGSSSTSRGSAPRAQLSGPSSQPPPAGAQLHPHQRRPTGPERQAGPARLAFLRSDFREAESRRTGLITAPENRCSRVAVNRLWQWHFGGSGRHAAISQTGWRSIERKADGWPRSRGAPFRHEGKHPPGGHTRYSAGIRRRHCCGRRQRQGDQDTFLWRFRLQRRSVSGGIRFLPPRDL